jgi:enoyl-CoA hydratase/carnithine racemase
VLLREDAGGVATLTLNRPDQYNALSAALLSALQSAVHDLARDESVRVVVIAGTGKAFCAGHDLKEMHEHADPRFAKQAFERCQAVMTGLTQLPQPVIARVHGPAFAAGCQLVAQCDLAVAVTDARFATSGVNYGIFCSTPGVPLARNVSRKRAMEMLLTGEPIDAATALAWGLVNRVVWRTASMPGAGCWDDPGKVARGRCGRQAFRSRSAATSRPTASPPRP